MNTKIPSSEKITDKSSNQSSFSEIIFNKQEPKSTGENTNKEDNSKKNNVKTIRKNTMELAIFRKEFVLVLKPMEMNLVPSKLRLNNTHFRHNKKNRNFFFAFLAHILKMKMI